MMFRGRLPPVSWLRGRECLAGKEKVGKRKQREDLSAVLGNAAIANLAIAELAFHHPEHVLDFGADFSEPAVASALR